MKEQYILDFVILIFLLMVVLLALAIVHARALAEVKESVEALPPSPEGTEKILKAISGEMEDTRQVIEYQQEMTRGHVSNTVGTISHNTDVTKGLVYELKLLYHGLVSLLISVVTPKKEPTKKDDIH